MPTALSPRRSVAGSSAYASGVSLGIIAPKPNLAEERSGRLAAVQQLYLGLLGRPEHRVRTPHGDRAVSRGKPGQPAQIPNDLAGKCDDARQAIPSRRPRTSGGPPQARRPALRGIPAGSARWRKRMWRQGRHSVVVDGLRQVRAGRGVGAGQAAARALPSLPQHMAAIADAPRLHWSASSCGERSTALRSMPGLVEAGEPLECQTVPFG